MTLCWWRSLHLQALMNELVAGWHVLWLSFAFVELRCFLLLFFALLLALSMWMTLWPEIAICQGKGSHTLKDYRLAAYLSFISHWASGWLCDALPVWRWMNNEWINVRDYSDTITVNCCRGTVQMLWVGSLEKCCFQLLTEAGQLRRRPDTSWQGVTGTCSRYWKCPVAECGSASWRHDKCWRARRSESTPSIYLSGQLKCLGEVRRCHTMQTPMSQNTQPVMDPLRDFQPVKFAEKWSCAFWSPHREH